MSGLGWGRELLFIMKYDNNKPAVNHHKYPLSLDKYGIILNIFNCTVKKLSKLSENSPPSNLKI